jgi:CubicO group peptidase (beta-lactamase class C family)
MLVGMTDLGSLAQQTADRLAAERVGVVVAAVAAGVTEIRGAGRTGGRSEGPPGAGTLFEIGSVTKVFTSLALARLAAAGAVELDEPLARLLPGNARVPSRGGEQITLRQLATHTSGLPRLPTGMLLPALLHPSKPDPYADCTTERLLRALARTRLGAVPGRRFRYSNFGGGLLGLALAHRAGVTYEELIAREIGTPLGLADTRVAVDPGQAARLAQGHTARRAPTPAWQLADLAGAGGLRSTATDLATFTRAHLAEGGELAAAIQLAREVRHQVTPFTWIHLGWLGRRLHAGQGGHLQLWHNGGTGGFCSFVGFDPEKEVGVVVLSNTQRSVDGPAFELLRSLQERH